MAIRRLDPARQPGGNNLTGSRLGLGDGFTLSAQYAF
jgi:hypothetical protein